MIDLSGKKAVVAGSEGLLGKAICALLNQRGAAVAQIDKKSGDSLCSDISTPWGWKSVKKHEPDIFVNASYPPVRSLEHFRAFIDGTANISAAMKRWGGGAIVNLASIYALVGPADAMYKGTDMGLPAEYAAVKGAIVAHSRCLAVRYAKDGIRINTVAAGGVFNNQDEKFVQRYCDRTPMGRMATPEEIAKVVVFLASDWAAYITGQCITVDGGYTAW